MLRVKHGCRVDFYAWHTLALSFIKYINEMGDLTVYYALILSKNILTLSLHLEQEHLVSNVLWFIARNWSPFWCRRWPGLLI